MKRLCTNKFQASVFTYYEDKKGDTKRRKSGGLGWLRGHSKQTNFNDLNRTSRYSSYHYCKFTTCTLVSIENRSVKSITVTCIVL